jgi:peroxiredoxin
MVSDLQIGSRAPDFDLPGVDGKNLSLDSFRLSKKAVVVVFVCNHCPYSVAYEERLLKFQTAYSAKGVGVVRINSDNETLHPMDTLDEMKKRSAGKGADFVYLRDIAGETAKAYGAEVAPEAFILDAEGVIRYAGRIDDCWQTPKRVRRHDLRMAIDSLLQGSDIAVKVTKPVGCAIRGKKP